MNLTLNMLSDYVQKKYMGSTHRYIEPSLTYSNVKKYFKVMGITRVANITGLDRIGIPVVMVCRPNSRSLSVSQGKGVDLISAKVSGVMESIESYHAERITLPIKIGNFEDLRYRYRLADVDKLPKTTLSTFHPYKQILWTEGIDLLNNEEVWVPYELVHTNYTIPKPTGSGCFNASSNGLASGNHLLEAVSHAICELIERDSTTLWYLKEKSSQERTRIDPNTIDDLDCRSIIQKFKAAEVDFGIWDTTSDVGVSSFLCLICDQEKLKMRSLHAAAGMGCHPVRSIALLRALTEAAQSRLTIISGSRDDIFREDYEMSRNPDSLRKQRELLRINGDMKSFYDCPTFLSKSFNEDLEWIIFNLRRVGIEEIVLLNLTHPYFNIPIARVIIPGLESLSSVPGYYPGDRARKLIIRDK